MRKMITCTFQQQLWLMLDIYCQYADRQMPCRLQTHAHKYCVVIRFLCKWKRRVGQIDRKPFCKKRKGCIGATWPVVYLSPTLFRSYAGCKLQVKQVPCTIRPLQATKRFILCWAELEKCPGSLPVPGRFAADSKLGAAVGSLQINSHTSTLKIQKKGRPICGPFHSQFSDVLEKGTHGPLIVHKTVTHHSWAEFVV